MRLGLFGGTFNPIHYGHLRAAEEVGERLELERVFFVPSALPPHKELADGTEAGKRLEIVRRAIAGNARFELLSFEVEAGGMSYSIRTIEHIRERYGVMPYFILGRDAFNEINTWYEFPRLFQVAHFAVMSRPGAVCLPLGDILGDMSAGFEKTDAGYKNKHGCAIIDLEVTPLDISSSAIRSLCRAGRSLRYLVPPAVEDYIRAERMYR